MVRKGSIVRRVPRPPMIYSVTLRRQPSVNIERDVKDTTNQLEQTSTRGYHSHSRGVG